MAHDVLHHHDRIIHQDGHFLSFASAVPALLVAAAGCAQPQAPGESTIPTFDPAYSSRMVLPHGVPLTLTGDAVPEQRLTLEVDGHTYDSVGDEAGRWQIGIPPLAAGGPYQIAIRGVGGVGEVLDDVLAGELWLWSGRSYGA
jgi:sialate O-acetylesterase